MTAIFTESEYEIELSAVQGPAGASQSVNYVAQTLTTEQKTQARDNIDALSKSIGSTANLPLITTASGVITVGSFGTSANTFCQGNDSRLSDARTPVAHNHSATEITSGELAKARQHAQTAYKDEATTFANTLTVNESISCRYGISIKELATGDSSWLLYRLDGGPTQPLYLRDLANSRTHASFTPAATSAIATTELFSNLFVYYNLFVYSNLTCGQASEGRVALVPGGGSAIGYVTFVKPNGTRQGYIGADVGNNISFTNEVGGKFVFGSDVIAEACTAFNGYFVSQESGVNKWMSYSVSGTYYLRDAANSRSHAIYFPGVNAAAALTQFSSRILVEESATFNGSVKLGIKTIATLPSAASSSGERYQVSDSATIANRIAFSNGSAWYYEGTAVAV